MKTDKTVGYALIGATAVGLVSALAVSPVALPMSSETTLEHIGYMLRVTARMAFVMLLLAYVARPLGQLSGRTFGLMRLRRYLGLSAALSHTVHFGYVCAYLLVSSDPTNWITVVFGGAAFGLMWVMALTSNNRAQRAMGLWWRRAHLVGMHYIWLIFMQTFVGVALVASSGWAQAMSVLGFVALAVRASAWLSQRFSRTA